MIKVTFPNSYFALPYHTTGPTEDELQNVEMAEAERTHENNELKIKRRDYTGYDDEEFQDGKQGVKRSLLSKYDEVLEGPRETVRHSLPTL
jgi:hypothetical protein